ncbi:MAG: alpha/beta fold hydrolase [Planctomycetota bacterium]
MRSFLWLAIALTWAVLFQASFAKAQENSVKESSVKKVGFEILQIKSLTEVVAWASKDISRKEFDALKLPLGWIKNQPRELEFDSAKFLNSPGMNRGEIRRAEHFGHQWLHVATVQLMDLKMLDSKGKLRGSTVVKDHWVTFDKGSLVVFLVSPDGKLFPRITRDANRTQEQPVVPEGWHLVEHKLDRRVEFRLTDKTTVIRADNQDSFQGPVEFAGFKNLEPANAGQFLQNKSSKEWNVDHDDRNGPSYGTPNAEQWMKLRKVAMDEDREFLMVNLIKYRKLAKYADGRKTDLTGRQANSLYSPIGFLARIGASIPYMGQVAEQLDSKSTPGWDEVAVVNYPSRAKFFEMVDDPEFRKRTVHKDAGLEFSQIVVTEPVPWALPNTKRIADQADAFTLVELLKYRDDLPEHPDSEERFSGKLALDACDAATEQIERRVGARRVLRSLVKGTLVGDGRNWDEFRMMHFPSESAFESYQDALRKMPSFRKERETAVEDYYLLKVKTAPFAKRIAASLATSFLGRLTGQSPATTESSATEVVEAHRVLPGVHRTPDSRFRGIRDFPHKPHYVDIDGLRMAYVDEGVDEKGTFLLLHGEPVWSYMYRGAISDLAAAGYRVIAPDNIGFGRSDKVVNQRWYTLDNHVRTLKRLVTELDLKHITIVVNDWGGPNGLVMATEMPDRFDRLIILNTWLHSKDYKYTKHLLDWNKRSQTMDFVNFPLLPPEVRAPFDSQRAVSGALRWPWMLPFAEPEAGNAVRQESAWRNLAAWDKPAHVIFGDSDKVFTKEWGRRFAEHIPNATFTAVKGEGHRPLLFTGPAGGQFTGKHRGDEFAKLVIQLIENE